MITWESLLKIESDIKRLQKNIERFESIARDEVTCIDNKAIIFESLWLNIDKIESVILDNLSLENLPFFSDMIIEAKSMALQHIAENRIDYCMSLINTYVEGVLKHFESLKTVSLESLSAEITKSKKITVEQINNFLYSLEDKREPTSLEVEMISRLKILRDRLKGTAGKSLTKNFIIKYPEIVADVYNLCNGDFFECEDIVFDNGIGSANFKGINVKRENCVKNLIYRLSFKFGSDWYSQMCENMNWKKSECSGQSTKLEFDPITQELNKFLPKPKK